MIETARSEAEPNKLLKIKEVAKMLSCSVWTVQGLIWRGELSFVKLGRVHRVELRVVEAYIDRHRDRRAGTGEAYHR
jgi:excisionase family DNA binding protein